MTTIVDLRLNPLIHPSPEPTVWDRTTSTAPIFVSWGGTIATGLTRDPRLLHDPPLRIHNAHARQFQ